MAVRDEVVKLGLEDSGFTTKMAKDAAVTALLVRELERLNGTSVKVNQSTSALGDGNGGIAKTGTQARKASGDLNQYTGRLSLLATAATTLGPALLPIGAVAIPAVTALAGGLGAAVGAVGTAVLAFHGLGDALKAVDAYQLEPTTANLQKLRDTLGELSPAAQDLVMRLDSLEPVLTRLQQTAQNKMFPGVNEGLDEILKLVPLVQDVVGRLATEMGTLAADAGGSLANDADWQAFFQFIRTDAAPTLDAFARATGNVIAGLGSMLVAFRPLSDSFTSGMLDMSRGFRDWAANLGDSAGFQSFVDYIRENGPQVAAFFESMAQALVALSTAAAPWGSVVLPVLTEVAKAFAVIAGSPIGPALFTAAAAMLALSRASALLGSQGLAKAAEGLTGLGASLRTMPGDLLTVHQGFGQVAASQDRLRVTMSRLGQAAKMAAGPAGMVALVDGMSKAGTAAGALETTLGGTLAGFSVGGPWGAAVGTGAGLLLNLAHTNDQAAASARAFSDTLDKQTGALTANSRAWTLDQIGADNLSSLKDAGVNIADMTTALVQGGTAWKTFREQMGLAGNDKGALFRNDAEDAAVKVDELANTLSDGKAAWQLFAEAGGEATDATGDFGDSTQKAAGQLPAFQKQMDQLTQKMREQRASARQTATSFTAFGASLNDSKVSLSSWIHSMAEQAKALRDFTSNARTAAKRGLRDGLIKELEAAGPAGAMRMKQLANASDSEIAKANRAWARGRAAIKEYIALKVPPKKIDVNGDGAINEIDTVLARLNLLRDRTIHITTVANKIAAGSAGTHLGGSADGSTVPKDGGPYGDRYPYLLAPGEEVISNRNGQADRFRPLLKAINAGRLADGGTAGPVASIAGSFGVDIDRGDSLKRRLSLFGVALDRATKKLDAETQARDSLMGSIKSNLTGDLWSSNNSSVFSSQYASGSVGDVNSRLRQQYRDANAMTALEKQLRARGVSGPALADAITNGGLAGLQALAAGSASDLRTYQQLYGQRTAAVNTAATTGANVLGMTSAIARTTEQVAVLTAVAKTIQHLVNASSKRHHLTAKEIADAINRAAKNARR